MISTSELGGQPYLAAYVADKAGLAGLTRNAAHAHRWDRIRINGLDIGWTDTEGEDAIQRDADVGDNLVGADYDEVVVGDEAERARTRAGAGVEHDRAGLRSRGATGGDDRAHVVQRRPTA